MGDTWNDCVKESVSVDEVLTLAQRYIASWDPESLARLPEDCLPTRLASYEDISAYAVTLVRRHFSLEGTPYGPELSRMSAFFTIASTRLAEILGTAREHHSRAFLRSLLLEDD